MRLWDPATRSPIGEPLHHPREVEGIAASPLPDGRTVLAVAAGASIWRWDPVTGQPIGPPIEHTNVISTLDMAAQRDGRVIIAVLSGAAVWLWDAATGAQALPPYCRTPRPRAMALVRTKGDRTVLATAHFPGIRLRHLSTGRSLPFWRQPHLVDGRVDKLSRACTGGGRPLLAAAVTHLVDECYSLCLRDARTGRRYRTVADALGIRFAAGLGVAHGRGLVALATLAGVVRILDVDRMVLLGPDLEGHRRDVEGAVLLRRPDGRHVLATIDDSGSTRLWTINLDEERGLARLRGRQLLGRPVVDDIVGDVFSGIARSRRPAHVILAKVTDPRESAGLVCAVTAAPDGTGRTVLACGTRIGAIELRDPASGERIGEPITAFARSVTALAVLPGDRGPLLSCLGTIHGEDGLEYLSRTYDLARGEWRNGIHGQWPLSRMTGRLQEKTATVIDRNSTPFTVTCDENGLVQVRDPASGDIVHRLQLGLHVDDFTAVGRRLILAASAGLVALDYQRVGH